MAEEVQTVRVIPLEERRAYVPSEVMGIVQFMQHRKRANASVPSENEKIRLHNETAQKYLRPMRAELKQLPEDTITMISPKTFIITLEDYTRITIPRGIFEIPIDLADHWYLQNNGAQRYNVPQALPKDAQLMTNTNNSDNVKANNTSSEENVKPSGVNDVLKSLTSKG